MEVNQRSDRAQHVDTIIIGAGPIGIELAVALKDAGINYLQFDSGQIGNTISWWPRNTHFFSTTERIEIAGVPLQNNQQARATGEEYLSYLRAVVEQFDLSVNTYEPVMQIERNKDGFVLVTHSKTGKRRYTCQRLVFAFGDMHAPNLLGIPGEDLPHVTHYFEGPHKYFRTRTLVVGGRNSAVETALRCWRAGAQVALSYRGAALDDQIVKAHILEDLLAQIEIGNIAFYSQSVPIEITPEYTNLQFVDGRELKYPADFVILNTGFVQDPRLFEMVGVNLIGERCVPEYDPETMQTNVPGVYLAGTAAAGTQKRYKLFIENSHEHVARIVKHLTGLEPRRLGTVPGRQYELPFEAFKSN
jgi:thioredoxin reductase (NADPH)